MLSLISIHVPKTAGTNFTQILEHLYGRGAIHFDYGTERDLQAARTPAPAIAADPEGFRRSHGVVHGHFHYLKYRDLFPDVPVLVTLRHPVQRVVSQYRHIALHGDPANERHRRIMEGEMDVEHFSAFRFIGNAQSVFLEGIEVEDLGHAVIQEHFPATVEGFCARAGFDPVPPEVEALVAERINSREREAWDTRAQPVDPAVLPRIEANCAQDLDLYRRAVEKFVRNA